MAIVHDNTATTWRDLADQLTPQQQIALSSHDGDPDPRAAAALLRFARNCAETNLADAAYAGVPLPAGVTDVTAWEKNTAGGYSRALVWQTFDGTGNVSVDIDGRQQDDGRFTREITVWAADRIVLSSEQARHIAATLIEVADAFDGLAR